MVSRFIPNVRRFIWIYSPISPTPDMAFFNLLLFFILIYSPSLTTQADYENGGITNSAHIPPDPPPPPLPLLSGTTRFQPRIAVIVAVVTAFFSIVFLLLLYVKHCRSHLFAAYPAGAGLSRESSGINRKVIESLPMFRFSSLRGQKDGLECAVCLSRFEPEEVLRLLPKCKHAFHVECVDTWLDQHSTCPLCRHRVDPKDIILVDNAKSLYNHGDSITPRSSDRGKGKENFSPRMFHGRHSSADSKGNSLEIIVEDLGQGSKGRVSVDSLKSVAENRRPDIKSKSLNSWRSFRRKGGTGTSSENVDRRRLEHRIIISDEDEAAQRRWSDVQAAEILYLRTEMILGEEEGSGRGVINDRSVSEITGMSRFRSNHGGGRERRQREEEGVMKRWLDWITQSKTQQQQQNPAGNSATSSSSIVV